MRDGGFGAAQSADVLDVEIREQGAFVHSLDGADRRRRPARMGGAVYEDMQPAERLRRRVHHSVDLRGVGGVEG